MLDNITLQVSYYMNLWEPYVWGYGKYALFLVPIYILYRWGKPEKRPF